MHYTPAKRLVKASSSEHTHQAVLTNNALRHLPVTYPTGPKCLSLPSLLSLPFTPFLLFPLSSYPFLPFPGGLGQNPQWMRSCGIIPEHFFKNLVRDLVHSGAFWRPICRSPFPLSWTFFVSSDHSFPLDIYLFICNENRTTVHIKEPIKTVGRK